jgi:hypothetical protein
MRIVAAKKQSVLLAIQFRDGRLEGQWYAVTGTDSTDRTGRNCTAKGAKNSIKMINARGVFAASRARDEVAPRIIQIGAKFREINLRLA